jgi:hypothetical protein
MPITRTGKGIYTSENFDIFYEGEYVHMKARRAPRHIAWRIRPITETWHALITKERLLSLAHAKRRVAWYERCAAVIASQRTEE